MSARILWPSIHQGAFGNFNGLARALTQQIQDAAEGAPHACVWEPSGALRQAGGAGLQVTAYFP